MTQVLEYKTQDAIAVAFSAYKINKGYIKDTARFSEPTNSTIFSNKDMVKFQFRPEFRPDDFIPFNTSKEDYEDVDNAMKHFRRYVFGIIGDNLTEFQRDIIDVASQRGAFKANEMEAVGKTFNKLDAFLQTVQKAEEEAKKKNEGTAPAEAPKGDK